MMNSDVHHVDAATTERYLEYGALIDALADAFRAGCTVPLRHHHTIDKQGEPDATLLVMPSWSLETDACPLIGVKLVTVFPGNASRNIPGLTSIYILFDGTTGRQVAQIDGNTITCRRTVATSALAARFLAREDASRLLVLGAGKVASLLPDAYRAVRPIIHVDVWDRTRDNAITLVNRLRRDGIEATVVDDLSQAVPQADIVTSATLATEPLIEGSWLRPGTHVDLIGAFTPEMREAGDDVIGMSSLFIDTPDALQEAGELVQAIGRGVISPGSVQGTLAQLCRGEAAGRTTPEAITCFKAVGSGLADLAAAKLLYSWL